MPAINHMHHSPVLRRSLHYHHSLQLDCIFVSLIRCTALFARMPSFSCNYNPVGDALLCRMMFTCVLMASQYWSNRLPWIQWDLCFCWTLLIASIAFWTVFHSRMHSLSQSIVAFGLLYDHLRSPRSRHVSLPSIAPSMRFARSIAVCIVFLTCEYESYCART